MPRPAPTTATPAQASRSAGGRDPDGVVRVRITSIAVGLTGLLVVLARARLVGLSPLVGVRPTQFHVHVQSVLVSFDVVLGLVLVVLAPQLRRRKRMAWRVAVGVSAAAAVTVNLTAPLSPAGLAPLVSLGLLLVWRRWFTALPDPPSLFALGRFLWRYALVVAVYGFGALWVFRGSVDQPIDAFGALETVASFGLATPYTFQGRFATVYPWSLAVLGVVGLVWSLVLVLRPLTHRYPHTPDDWRVARRILHESGWDTLNYFCLRDDKSFFFSSDGHALIAYTYIHGYGLVSGDPVGPPGSVDLVLDEFLAFCRRRGWKPAFLSVRESDTPRYEARNLRTFYLGDEAIIRCDAFTLEGKKNKSLRQSVGRVARTYRFEVLRECDAPPDLVRELNAISARWRGKAPERGFTMTLVQDVKGPGADDEFLLCVALDEDDRPGGFLRIVPAFGVLGHEPGYTLDLMRHDPGTPNGMTEFLIANAALRLGEQGVVRLSMNFATLGKLFDPEIDYPWHLRVVRWFVRKLNPYFQIESLRTFNQKFRPEWAPRMVVFKHPSDLPRVSLLFGGVEGFLHVPVLGPLFVPRTVGGATAPTTAPPA